MEDKQRYHCIAITKQGDRHVALIGDAEVMGESEIKALQQAPQSTRAHLVMRHGVTTYAADALQNRIEDLRRGGMDKSADDLARVLGVVQKRDLQLRQDTTGMSLPRTWSHQGAM